MNNRDRFIEIMVDKNLERRELAEILKVDREVIDHWLLPTESTKLMPIPDMAIELLEVKLGMRDVVYYKPESER
ncbi:MAG: hypothetical protein AAF387_10550 [Pseudomonadota bacterium]